MTDSKKILLYGYGNTTRQDDRLGIEFIHRMQEWLFRRHHDAVDCKTSAQLNLEDAEEVAAYDIVILVDASVDHVTDYSFSKIETEATPAFTTHTVSPSNLLKLSRELYQGNPEIYLLQIQGYEWDFSEQLTIGATANLEKAVTFAQKKISELQSHP